MDTVLVTVIVFLEEDTLLLCPSHPLHPAAVVGSGRGTQIGCPVMTVVTTEQTGCAGAACARASRLAAAKNAEV